MFLLFRASPTLQSCQELPSCLPFSLFEIMNITSDQRYQCSNSLAVSLDFPHEVAMTTASARKPGIDVSIPFSLRFASYISFTAVSSLSSDDAGQT